MFQRVEVTKVADRLIGLSEAMKQTRLCRSAIYAGQKNGTFPISIKVGVRAIAFSQRAIDAWIEHTIAASQSVKQSGSQADRSAAA